MAMNKPPHLLVWLVFRVRRSIIHTRAVVVVLFCGIVYLMRVTISFRYIGVLFCALATPFIVSFGFQLHIVNAADTVVSGSAGLRSALSSASPGDTIIVASGTYTGDYSTSRSGSAQQPLIIRAQNQGGAVFKDSLFTISGNYVTLEGMMFDNGQVTLSGNNNRLTKSVFQNGKPGSNESKLSSAVEAHGSNNRIDHNEVKNWQRRGLRIRSPQSARNNVFDHNYLHNFSRAGGSGNSGDALQSGVGPNDANYQTKTIFEYNLLESVEADDEAISIKSTGNIIRYNTFKNSNAVVQNRQGNNNEWLGNTIISMDALAIYGDNNKIIGNTIKNSHLIIRNGSITAAQVTSTQGHPAARNTLVACNTVTGGHIGIGTRIPNGTATGGVSAQNTTLAGNQGTVEYGAHSGTKQGSYNCGSVKAVELSPSNVGPSGSGGGSSTPGNTNNNACHLLQPSSNIPAGFGVPWNTQSAAGDLLISVACSSQSATVTVGSGGNIEYIYASGYEYKNNGWQPISFTGNNQQGGWLVGEGTATLQKTQAELSQNNFVVAYICLWDGSVWKCGCRDKACTQNLWQVQVFKQ